MEKLSKIQMIELEMLLEIERIATKNNITYYLAYGTALGAVRHNGFIPWDTDVDIVTDINNYNKLCECIIRELNEKYALASIDTDDDYDSLKARVSLKSQNHHTIHVDIFPLVGSPSEEWKKKLFSKICFYLYRIYFVKKVKPNVVYKDKLKKRFLAKLAKVLIFPLPKKIVRDSFEKMSYLYPIGESEYLYNICGSYGLKEFVHKEIYGTPVYKDFEGHKLPIPEKWDKYLTNIYNDYMTPKKKDYV